MLPEKFCQRMKGMLGDEYPLFLKSMDEDAVKALRVNPLKISDTDLIAGCGLALSPLSYAEHGYLIEQAPQGLGNTPLHQSGAFYMQDPGAMAAVAAVPIKEGWRVLDLCAAPGGKTTQAAALIGDTGFIHSNEYVPKRAKVLVSNIERMGIKNSIVTSLDTAEIAKLYSAYFDLVICDAPCSGEGMFRKNDAAKDEWSEQAVEACAIRQKGILENAAVTVKDGGYLLYSTCTYSIEENEKTVMDFLDTHTDFRLCETSPEVRDATAEGAFGLTETRRFYPHRSRGEGQFIALMQRRTQQKEKLLFSDCAKPLSRVELAIAEKFLKENLNTLPDGRIVKHADNVIILPKDVFVPPRSVFCAGVLIGEIRGKLLFPSHQLFSAYGKDFKLREELDEQRARAYIAGEEIPQINTRGSGYIALSYLGATLGGGKASQGTIKNHYPKGLRIR